MGTRETYEPGTFSWAELATTDADAAKAFYGELFGWSFEDSDDRRAARTYSMASLDGSTSARCSQADGPPRWNSYITVEDADDAAEKAKEAGAEIVADPFDVMDAGPHGRHPGPVGRRRVGVAGQGPHRRRAGQRAGRAEPGTT